MHREERWEKEGARGGGGEECAAGVHGRVGREGVCCGAWEVEAVARWLWRKTTRGRWEDLLDAG